jgi:site-specific recombinase XerD
MKQKVLQMLSETGQQTLDQYMQALQRHEDLSVVTVHNYLSDLRPFIPWYGMQNNHSLHYSPNSSSSTTDPRLGVFSNYAWLETSHMLMSWKRFFTWAKKTPLIQPDHTSPTQ